MVRDLLLVCATASEMRAAVALLPGGPQCDLSLFEQGAPLAVWRDTSFALPRLCLPRGALALLVCGVGPVVSALSLALAIERERPGIPGSFGGVLNMGIAGSYDLGAAPVGSVVLVDWECFPEYGVWPEYDESLDSVGDAPKSIGQPQPLRFAQAILPTGPVFSRLDLDAHNTLGKLALNGHASWRTGGGATLSGVSGTKRRADRMQALTGALIENMEGFALSLGAAALGLPFVEVRSVSNRAGCRPPHTWNVDAAARALSLAAQDMFAPLL